MVASPVSPIIVMTVFLTALIILVRLGRPTVSALLLIGVWTLMTTLGPLRSGVSSLGPAFLVIPICAAGLLIDGVASLSLAALATVLVAAWPGWRRRACMSRVTQRLRSRCSRPPSRLGFLGGLFWTVALLTWLLAGGCNGRSTEAGSRRRRCRS